MKISVLTPSFNSGDYIERSIQSVLSQTYKNWEHIIIDGNSTDNTVNILKRHKHLKWVSESDKGQSDAMNKAFKISKGDFIVYLNSDDYFYPDAFKTLITNFTKNPKIDIIVGNLHLEKKGLKEPRVNATISWKDLSVLKGRFPLNPVSYMYKRKVQQKIGDFPVDEHYTMDYWFLLRAFYFFKTIKIEEFLGCFVFVENNKSSRINGEFDVQSPHALKFCLRYTPLRFFYVYAKLLIHHNNPQPNKVVLYLTNLYVSIKKIIKQ
ncbi:glycosyltransferase family 2 protein [uncultured Polaribacter sp.]|uniref:glycosyltransferase family 2 protein n=1 Tax=uncultured Polaribacter sp. TaxID=174711 RepID=UPI00260CDA08|nr:glycosyltransferase family 2 protein [uncultured Polaribacter sp.]